MKNLSRLTALLLALVMLLSITASATEISDYTKTDYDAAVQELIVNFPNLPVDQQLNLLLSYGDNNEMVYQLLNQLDDEKYNAFVDYTIQELNLPSPVSSTYTNAGPFMEAVNMAPVRMRMMALANTEADDGVVTSKVITSDDQGGYNIRLESYVTGETTVVTNTTTTPVDIVLVLDQSGSMRSDFSGNDTKTDSHRRQYAMKAAVNNFIDSVNGKYNADTADHRMAIVTFGSSASTLQTWTYVDAAGTTTLQGKISGLPNEPSGATNVEAGMSQANGLLTSGYAYTGKNTTRQRVVIVFTDGIPTTSSDFSTTVANGAISAAKSMKDAGKDAGVTVYTVGIFNGVDKNQLYGEKWDYTLASDISCTGEVGSYWGGSWLTSIVGRNDFDGIDIAAGNRFLNYLSSNFIDATEIGVSRGTYDPGNTYVGGGTGYKITKNFTRTSSDYYLTATDSDSLNNIFQTISENIQTGSASVQLGSDTVVKDIITDYFTLPEDAEGNADLSKIKVYTADYNADGTWDADVASALTPTVSEDGKTVSVTGFDFSANYCDTTNGRVDGNNDEAGDFYGRKLIIEIPIEVMDGFIGGNGVPTNEDISGIYASDGKLADSFVPNPANQDIGVEEITPTAENINIYLTNSADLSLLATPNEYMIDGVVYTVDGVNNAYASITYIVKDGENVIATYTIDAGETSGTWMNGDAVVSGITGISTDKTYTVTCTVDGTNGGTSNTTTEEATASVKVFKPVLTFQDSAVNYLASVVDPIAYYNTNNYLPAETVWKNGDIIATAEIMTGNEPELTLDYTADAWITDNKVTSVSDVNGNVTVKVGDVDITSETTTIRNACTIENCAHTADSSGLATAHNPEFVIHIQNVYGKLVIAKNGLKAGESAIFTVKAIVANGTSTGEEKEWTVVLTGTNDNGTEVSATLTGLLVGSSYTAQESGDWSWSYTCSGPVMSSETILPLTAVKPATATFTNTKTDKWLSDESAKVNTFATVTE